MRRMRLLTVMVIVVVWVAVPSTLTATVSTPGASEPQDVGIEIEPQLQAQLDAEGAASYTIYFRERPDLSPALQMDWHKRGWFVMRALQDAAGRSQARVRAYLEAQDIQYESFWIDNVLVVSRSSRAAFDGLQAFPEIGALRARRAMGLVEPEAHSFAPTAPVAVEPNIAHIQADKAWALGINGAGSVVASIDTGVRYTHQALVNHYRGNLGGGVFDHNYNWWDPYGDHPAAPADDNGHGTHTTGTMVGNDGEANQIGMAPGAGWIACRGCDADTCADAALLECAQFVAAPWDLNRANANPDKRPYIVNNSWGDCSQTYDNSFQTVVDNWHAVGIYPVFSSGNASSCQYTAPPLCGTVGNPARYGNVTAVGSTGTSNGQYASHSNRGPTDNPDAVNPRGYPTIKPQVVAPGVSIRSSVKTSDFTYSYMTGTSMSAPHVAGLVALMWQAGPCLRGNYAWTETLIEQTATPITTNLPGLCSGEGPGNLPNQSTGWGEINALAAVQAAQNVCGTMGALTGQVTDSDTSAAIPSAVIRASLSFTQTWNTTSNSQGSYTLTLMAGVYTVTAQLYRYLTQEITGVQVISGATTTQNIALVPLPPHVVSGTVTDADASWPVYASINIKPDGYPGWTMWNDPVSSWYSVTLPEGITHTLTVSAWVTGYNVVTRAVSSLTTSRTENFTLTASSDACDAPGRQLNVFTPVFTESFDTITSFPGDGWGQVIVSNTGAYSSPAWSTLISGTHPTALPHSGARLASFNSYDADSGDMARLFRTAGLDLSSLPNARVFFWMFHYQGGYSSDDRVQVQVSTDGGGSWNDVGSPVFLGESDAGWTRHMVDLSAYTGAGMTDVRIAFLGVSGYGYNIHIDDVTVAPATCDAQAGGLVVGNAYDADSLIALTGVQVSNDSGGVFTTTATTDPDVPDSRVAYTLFSLAGSRTFTATMAFYSATITTTNVVQSSTVRQDFYLHSAPPDLAISKTGPATALSGDWITYTIVYTNVGQGLALGVRMTDTLPTSMTAGGPVTWSIGTLPPGACGTRYLTATVGDLPAGTLMSWRLTNDVVIAATNVETNTANNSAQWTLEVMACVPATGLDFAFAPGEPLVGQVVVFTGTLDSGSIGVPITYTWDWGDGSAAQVGDPITHTFPLTYTQQTYTVTLTAANACSQPTAQKLVTVRPHTVYLPIITRQ